MLKLFVCNDHPHKYMQLGSAVILAENEQQARELLVTELRKTLGENDEFWNTVFINIQEVENLDTPKVVTFSDGNY